MKTLLVTSAAALLCCSLLVVATVDVSQPPIPSEEILVKEDSDVNTAPSDVASVSKFIKEFHRQIDDEVYWTPERPGEPVQEPDYVDSSTPVIIANQSSPAEVDEEVNSTFVVSCRMDRQAGSLTVELVNSTRLASMLTTDPNITSRGQKADCVVLLFYARTCPFSCMAAPHFNALPRAYPSIKMAAVNALHFQSFNTQYGIVGVPTVMLFHNGRPAAKFNDSEYTLEMFSRFITRHTGIQPEEKMFVTSVDFGGPVGSVMAKETDYWLGLAWLVIGVVGGVGVAKSRMWLNIVEAVQDLWRETEAQHFHTE
uniref:Thioredoxin domain-containing protein n=1 Tax=Graphocephala atropunctata TaxID=36148 RepID=A0A1B6M390_9HEMI